MGLNYVWLATCMPWQVALGSVTLGGFIVGSLVSATHQSEEIMDASNAGEYVDGQFRSTRDAETVFGPLETWIWGGMDTAFDVTISSRVVTVAIIIFVEYTQEIRRLGVQRLKRLGILAKPSRQVLSATAQTGRKILARVLHELRG